MAKMTSHQIFNFGCPPTTNFQIEFCYPDFLSDLLVPVMFLNVLHYVRKRGKTDTVHIINDDMLMLVLLLTGCEFRVLVIPGHTKLPDKKRQERAKRKEVIFRSFLFSLNDFVELPGPPTWIQHFYLLFLLFF